MNFNIKYIYNKIAEDPNANNSLEQVHVQLGSRARLECRAAKNPATQDFLPPITYSWSKLRGQGRRTGISRHTSRQGVILLDIYLFILCMYRDKNIAQIQK